MGCSGFIGFWNQWLCWLLPQIDNNSLLPQTVKYSVKRMYRIFSSAKEIQVILTKMFLVLWMCFCKREHAWYFCNLWLIWALCWSSSDHFGIIHIFLKELFRKRKYWRYFQFLTIHLGMPSAVDTFWSGGQVSVTVLG